MKPIIVAIAIIGFTLIARPPRTSNHALSGSQASSGGRVHGLVHDALGVPLEKASVMAFSSAKQIASSLTDREGRYALTSLPEGEILIEVRHPGFITFKQTTQVRASVDSPLDFCLEVGLTVDPPEFRIAGQVLDDLGRGIAGASVVVTNPYNQVRVARTVTDEAGKYELHIFRVGQYVLVAYKPRFIAASETLVIYHRPRESVNFALTPLRLRRQR